MGRDIGIEISSDSISLSIKGGAAFTEPFLAAADKETGAIIKIGTEARLLLGRAPGNIAELYPLKNGNIKNSGVTRNIIDYFIKKAGVSRVIKPSALVCISKFLASGSQQALTEILTGAGIKKVYYISKTMAAALGAGIDISLPGANMVINIDSDSADIAVISLNAAVVSENAARGGDGFAEGIVRFIKDEYNVIIDIGTAQCILAEASENFDSGEEINIDFLGKGAYDGLPKRVAVSSGEINSVLLEEVKPISEAAVSALKKTPPELYADIRKNGMTVTGNISPIKIICRLIGQDTAIKTRLADEAENCVINGTAIMLDRIKTLTEGEIFG